MPVSQIINADLKWGKKEKGTNKRSQKTVPESVKLSCTCEMEQYTDDVM